MPISWTLFLPQGRMAYERRWYDVRRARQHDQSLVVGVGLSGFDPRHEGVWRCLLGASIPQGARVLTAGGSQVQILSPR